MITSPIEYKTVPTQYAFLVSDDGLVKVQAMRELPSERKFASESEARKWISNLRELI